MREIGLEVNFEPLTEPTVLPGIDVHHGTLAIDAAQLKYPGDLLHEAGHLAVVTPQRRRRMHRNVGQKAYEEMLAIAWSYAAAVHLNMDVSVVFHADGYRGWSATLLENFSHGRYFAVCTLAWLGMTVEPKSGIPPTPDTYPKMRKWVLD